MIKYFEVDSINEYGQQIIPINPESSLCKLSSDIYSPELSKIILGIKRSPEFYYVIINAVGSLAWSFNRNGDGFPKEGLSHVSLLTDIGTSEEYGYRTFMTAKFYKHHVNKDPKLSYGYVAESIWNPKLERIELIVGIDREKGKDIIDALESGDNVSTSMGCLTNPDYPILTIDGYKPIKDIQIGNLVFTHQKQWRKVTQLHRRKYTGKLCELLFYGLPVPLELTADHPMMAQTFQCTTNSKKRVGFYELHHKEFDWSHAECLEKNDQIQYIPSKYDECEFAKIGDEKLAELMGYYIAEGSFTYNDGKPAVIQLSCNINDDLPRRVPGLIHEMFPGITCSIKPHHRSQAGLVVEIFSTDLACFLDKYFSHLAHNKKIPPEIFVSEKNIKLSFLNAWMSGDGWVDKKGLHWSSCNLNLVLQGRDLLASCGIMSSIYKNVNPGNNSSFSRYPTTCYALNISAIDAMEFLPYASRKLSKLEFYLKDRIKEGNTSIKKNDDGTFSYRIKEIKYRNVENIQTYNFEVEEDESYSAAGLISHNCRVKFDRCSICNNKAATRATYCKHLKNHLREIIDENLAKQWSKETGLLIRPGAIVGAINDFPKFFDISRVYRGADVTSMILGKAASKGHCVSGLELAEAYGVTDEMVDEMDKVSMLKKRSDIDKKIEGNKEGIDGQIIAIPKQDDTLKNALNEVLGKTIQSEPRIPNEVLDPLAKTFPLDSILSTMLHLGVHPRPQEMQRIVLISMKKHELANELDSNNMCFDCAEPCNKPAEINTHNNYNDVIAKALLSYLEKRSSFPMFLDKRASFAGFDSTSDKDYWAESGPRTGSMIETSPIPKSIKAIGGLAAIYAGLKLKAAGFTPKQVIEIFISKPYLRALLGSSAMLAIVNKMMSPDSPGHEYLMRPASEYGDILKDTHFSGQLQKFSSLNNVKLSDIISTVILPSAYIMNSYEQKSMSKIANYDQFPNLKKLLG